MTVERAPWLVLMHSIPPKPPYLRAKVMRRLTHLGALALKRSAYLLPLTDATLEDFQWLRQEIQDEGGEAWVVEARFMAGLRDDAIRESFRSNRAADYAALSAEARTLLEQTRSAAGPADMTTLEGERRRLRKRLDATTRIDFFDADGRQEVEVMMSTIERLSTNATKPSAHAPRRDELQARTWVTRKGVKVDRMASAWLIRRFIDPAGVFVFVEPDTRSPVADALRFDMFEGEFTHDGDRCTFEVLLGVSGHATDPGLAAIAQIVHDIDLREDRYQRAETAGVAAFVDGIVARFDDDHRRLAESSPIFENLYASLGGQALNTSASK